ncbi:MAG: hypothetical protein JGK28_15155 [Microcoleus sp. PH2017_07_MST_O_A]|nr:hypothetical protein [Microcoleus sp. PH2017_07_MST_O_A]MCC3511498.1 hypothetical protein [Microcoleus sp. PH2017_17_BER_D_A]
MATNQTRPILLLGGFVQVFTIARFEFPIAISIPKGDRLFLMINFLYNIIVP